MKQTEKQTMSISPRVKTLLKEWGTLTAEINEVKEKLKPLTDREMVLRKELASHFENVIEGTKNVLELANGYSLKLNYKLKRSVDEAAFNANLEAMKKANVPVDILFKTEPTLVKGIYSKLNASQIELVDQCLVTTPDTPTLEMVAPKK